MSAITATAIIILKITDCNVVIFQAFITYTFVFRYKSFTKRTNSLLVVDSLQH